MCLMVWIHRIFCGSVESFLPWLMTHVLVARRESSNLTLPQGRLCRAWFKLITHAAASSCRSYQVSMYRLCIVVSPHRTAPRTWLRTTTDTSNIVLCGQCVIKRGNLVGRMLEMTVLGTRKAPRNAFQAIYRIEIGDVATRLPTKEIAPRSICMCPASAFTS